MFIWGDPIWVNSQSSQDVLEAKRCELEEALNQITFEADRAVP